MATLGNVVLICGFSVNVFLQLLVLGSSSVKGEMVDLTHPINSSSIHGTSFKDFELKIFLRGNYGGHWVEANDLDFAEHTGTHFDAPAHTSENGARVDEIPLKDLVGPAVVINITQKALKDRNYLVNVKDFTDFEEEYGRMPDGSIVLLKTDRSKYYWSDRNKYLDTNDITNMSTYNNPGFSVESINRLVSNRNIRGIGTDCFNIDIGLAHSFPAHVAINSAGRFAIESLNNVVKLPPTGATLFVMILPIQDGSGGPARVVALWDTDLPVCSSCGPKTVSIMMVFVMFSTVRCFW